MTDVKTYRATERGYYHVPGQGFALAEEGETITTDSPAGSWMEEVAASEVAVADDKPDYASLNLPEITRMAVERGIKPDATLKGVALKKSLVAALEAGDA